MNEKTILILLLALLLGAAGCAGQAFRISPMPGVTLAAEIRPEITLHTEAEFDGCLLIDMAKLGPMTGAIGWLLETTGVVDCSNEATPGPPIVAPVVDEVTNIAPVLSSPMESLARRGVEALIATIDPRDEEGS